MSRNIALDDIGTRVWIKLMDRGGHVGAIPTNYNNVITIVMSTDAGCELFVFYDCYLSDRARASNTGIFEGLFHRWLLTIDAEFERH